MAVSHKGSACCSRAQPVCEYCSIDWTNSIVDVGISKGASGVLPLEGASGESTPSKGVALVAARVARWIDTVKTGPMGPSDETIEGETMQGGRDVRTAVVGWRRWSTINKSD